MTTVKSVIVPTVGTTLTSAYTNSTAGAATLKAVNATGIGDPNVWTVETGSASEWTYVGTPNPAFIGAAPSTAGNTIPYPIQLSADRVLLLWAPAHTHVGGGNDYLGGTVLHTQIVEYTGTKYRAGPIVNLALPDAIFNSQTVGPWTVPTSIATQGQSCVQHAVISSTKVAIAYRQSTFFKLIRLNIVGNSLAQANVVSFDLAGASAFNSTTPWAFDLAVVRGDTNQVVVGATNGTNWSLQAFNIPDSGAITTASTLFNTSLSHTTGHFAIAPMNGTAVGTTTTYIVAANTTSTTTISFQNFSYNSATTTFAAVGSAVTTAVTATNGITARCLSGDGTANAVVGFFNTGSTSAIQFARQISLTQASNSLATATLPSAQSARAVRNAYKWGTDRAVFITDANGVVVYDSAGTSTPLVTSTDATVTTTAQPLWYPFDSRPLYSFFDTGVTVGKVSQLIARTGMTSSTSVGVPSLVGNYLPYGHPYGGDCAWSSVAQCWFVGFGGRIYALSDDGVVLSEVSLYDLLPGIGASGYLLSVKQLDVLPSGRIIFLTDTQGTSPTAGYYGQYWASVTATTFGFCISAVTSPTDLAFATLLASTNFGFHVVADLATYVDAAGVERALGLYLNASTNAIISAVRFDGAAWTSAGNTSVTNTTLNSSFNFGSRPNIMLVQDSPASSFYPTGLWRVFGMLGTNSQLNMAYMGITTSALTDQQATSFQTNTVLNNTTAAVYSAVKSQSLRSASIAVYDTNRSAGRYYFVVNGRLIGSLQGILIAGASSMQFMNSITSKYGFVISPCNTSTAAVAQSAYVFDTINPTAGPRYTLTATSGNGWTTLERNNGTQLDVFAAGVNTRYTVSGPDTANLIVTVSSVSDDFYVLPVNGQTIDTSKSSSYRNTDVYLIPPNYSVKLKSTLAGSLSAMLTIVEDV